MKKILALLSGLVLMTSTGFSVVACNNDKDSESNLKKINEVKKQVDYLNERLMIVLNSIVRIQDEIDHNSNPNLLPELEMRLAEAKQSEEIIRVEAWILCSQWAVLEIDNAKLVYSFSNYDTETIREMIKSAVNSLLRDVSDNNKNFYYDIDRFDILYTWEFSANVYGFAYTYVNLSSTQVITILEWV